MDRLTKRDGKKVWFLQGRPRGFLCPDEFCGCAYSCKKVKDRTCPYLQLLDKPAAYEDAEEQGRLVPVVRCKDCKHAKKYSVVGGSIPYLFCREWCHSTHTDGYCHYGERKDGDKK